MNEFIIIPCWGNVNGSGNEKDDEGSFKLAIACNVDFNMRMLAGKSSRRGDSRKSIKKGTGYSPKQLCVLVKLEKVSKMLPRK